VLIDAGDTYDAPRTDADIPDLRVPERCDSEI
jgi:hypothetical protein